MTFTFTKCEVPDCLEAGELYHYPKEERECKVTAAFYCENHASSNGFCSYCKSWKGLSAWFHSSGLCEECFDNVDEEDLDQQNEYPDGC